MAALREKHKKLLYDDEIERRLHLSAMKMLSDHAGLSADMVERLYEIVLDRLKREAKIKDFLPILVSRRVRYLLNKKELTKNKVLKSKGADQLI
ncbi:MAG TPA: hypothetical protein DCP92_02745 [Nitrospiraceae bacterium]|jgi:hypothetical protein|nr:hypothetical protein [Nitrospiraceae bacterium]